jgi:hypothetical protein
VSKKNRNSSFCCIDISCRLSSEFQVDRRIDALILADSNRRGYVPASNRSRMHGIAASSFCACPSRNSPIGTIDGFALINNLASASVLNKVRTTNVMHGGIIVIGTAWVGLKTTACRIRMRSASQSRSANRMQSAGERGRGKLNHSSTIDDCCRERTETDYEFGRL